MSENTAPAARPAEAIKLVGRALRQSATPMRPLPGDWDGLIVVCASASWDESRLGTHFLAEALARRAPVLFVDPPLSMATPLRHPRLARSVQEPRLRLIRPGFARLTPVVPPAKSRKYVHPVVERVFRNRLRRAVAALGGNVRAVISSSPLYNPFGVVSGGVGVFRVSDDFAAGADLMGVGGQLLVRGEQVQAREADVIFCEATPLMEKWQAQGFEPVLIPNGADIETLGGSQGAARPADVTLPDPVLGFVGRVGARIDWDMLRACRRHSVLIVGPAQTGYDLSPVDDVLSAPTVQWVGHREFDQLPAYMSTMAIGLVPYTDTTFNRAGLPLKTLEYLAAGIPVVSSDIPAHRALDTDLVAIASDPGSFAAEVETMLARVSPELSARCRDFAAGFSWDEIARRGLAAIDDAAARVSAPG